MTVENEAGERPGKRLRPMGLLIAIGWLLAACGASPHLAVTDVFGLPGSIGGVCAAYFTIDNPTDQADALIGVSSNIAEVTEMHAIIVGTEGVLAMEWQAQVSVPARGRVAFQPGGLHIMFTNLKRDLNAGDSFPLTLHFQQRGEIQIQVTVKEL
ncbi:MAG TPA: copper chaperone PCu(A)C [Anaerolineae bacterium]|nr:copper chaperone PCu(A)C [Anaerolineae bacterium]